MLANISKASILFLVLTVFVCSTAELILLEIKYSFFAGGFLQVYPLGTLLEKIGFTAVFFALNLLFYSLALQIFKLFLFPYRLKSSIVGFNFFMLSSIVTAVALTVQLQLHRYFADAMNAALIKNIAGGDLNTAIAYVSDELFLFGVGIVILVVLYFLINKALKEKLIAFDDNKNRNFLSLMLSIFSITVLLVPAIFLVNHNDTIRNNIRYSNAYLVSSAMLNNISDLDNDGFGSFRFPFDSEALNSSVYPGALDIPGNGIDEDGFFGDFTYKPSIHNDNSLNKVTGQKHVVIVVLESARADMVDKIINGKAVAPNLNKLALEGTVKTDTYSHTGFTSTSLATLFSGKFGEFHPEYSMFKNMKDVGYQISIYSGQDESWGDLDKKLKTRELTDYFYDAQVGVEKRIFSSTLPSSIKLSEETLWNEFNGQISKKDWNVPQFIYFNFQAAHFPYFHEYMTTNIVEAGIPRSEININNKDWLEKTYWNSLNYADLYLGKVIDDLKRIGVWENTLLIVTGDHGEELFDEEHLGHGFLISKVQLNIPFVTNQSNFNLQQPAGLVDIKSAIFRFLENKSIPEHNSKPFVFQYIGSLSQPQKIAIRFSHNEVFELDLLKMQVNLHHTGESLPFQRALKDKSIEKNIKFLVDHWATIRWVRELTNE